MRFGSVASGIEAASVAFHPLGWEAAWLAEVDVAASAVLAHRWGATAPVFPMAGTEKSMQKIAWGDRLTNWGDMTVLPGLIASGQAEAPDVFCGGCPCQSFSIAGLRKGLEDARGNLTLTFVQIANEIDIKRAENGDEPCIILYENVPGLLTDKTNAFGCFLAGLAGEDDALEPPGGKWTDAGCVVGPQRTVAWRTLDAQFFNLAQRRKRVFVIASACADFDPAAVLFEFDGLRRDTPPSREPRQNAAGTADARFAGGSHWDDPNGPRPSLNQSHNTGGVGQSNQELFSQRGAYLVPAGNLVGWGGRHSSTGDVAHCLNAGGMGRIDYESETMIVEPMTYSIQERAVSENPNAGPGGKGWNADNLAYTLEARHHVQAVAVALRGREGGGTIEMGDECAGTLRASGGGDKPHVLTVVHGTQDPCTQDDLAFAMGWNNGGENVVLTEIGMMGPWKSYADWFGVCWHPDCLQFDDTPCNCSELGAPAGWYWDADEGWLQERVFSFSCKDYGSDATLDVAPTMRAMGHSGSHANAVGQLAVAFVQNSRDEVRLMGEDGQIVGALAAQPGAKQTCYIAEPVCITGDITHTLKAEGFDASEDGTGRGQPIVATEMAVRRLMPIEAERLQGFPDGYTLVPIGNRMAADGPRYKQLGNSWAIPCVRWIGERIKAHLENRVIEARPVLTNAQIIWMTAA